MKTSTGYLPSERTPVKEGLQHGNRLPLRMIYVIVCAVVLYMFAAVWYQQYPQTILPTSIGVVYDNSSVEYMTAAGQKEQCPDVMSEMTDGSWITRPLTEDEKNKIHSFLIIARSHYGIPASMQRVDNRCGNLGFPGLHVHEVLEIRALCDPLGNTACCSNYTCVNRTTEGCSCRNCYDLRQVIHAEYSTWRVKDPRCQPRNHSSDSACGLLSGSRLYFMGDSYLRQMYVMMTMHLTQNYVDSALRSNTPTHMKKKYSGPFQLLCYAYLNLKQKVCKGQTALEHQDVSIPTQAATVMQLVTRLRNTPRTIIMFGQGIHRGYNVNYTLNALIEPVLRIYNRTGQLWPKLVWVAPHAHGLLKMPLNHGQSDEHLKQYNSAIKKKLREWNVTYMDTFPMTQGVMAYDGAHYGTGVNMLKIRLVYNYLEELRKKGLW